MPDRPPDAAWLKLRAEPGLCQACGHARLNETRRGTAYLRCTRAAWDSALSRYPRLPVMLTGRTTPAAPGLVFYDAWEIAGDGTPGHTWSDRNPLAAVAMYPDRRMDYVLSAWPRRGGIGHPVRCQRLGVLPADEPQLSDHYGVLADLRY